MEVKLLRFCNNCGTIIIGIKCTRCFGMDLTSSRSKLLNRELFSPLNRKNSLLTRELNLERKVVGPVVPTDIDLSKKLSENRLNAVKNEIKLPKVVENLSTSAPLKGNTAEKIIQNQDQIHKERNEWVDSVKEDVNIITSKDTKKPLIEPKKIPITKNIPEDKKYKV